MKRRLSPKFYKMPSGYNRLLHFTVILVGLFGVVMQVSASMSSSNVTTLALAKTAIKQIIFFAVSYYGMLLAANWFSFTLVRQYIDKIVIGTAVFLIAALAFPSVGGAYAWIRLPFINATIQPSEFAKIAMILIMAVYLGDIKKTDVSGNTLIKRPLWIFAIYFLIIMIFQRDFGSALILLLITAVCFLIPSHPSLKKQQLIVLGLTVLFLALMRWLLSEQGIALLDQIPVLKYQVVRFKAASDPFTNRYDIGFYDLVNSLIAFNTGGWKGVGLGRSLRKYGYLSAADTDFIMAVIVEELGIGGFLVVFFGYAILLVTIMKYALKAMDEKSKITMVGVAMYFFVHFVFNIGGVTCLIPLTGIPLLLVSAGGSSSLACMGAIGIVQALIVAQKQKESLAGSEK